MSVWSTAVSPVLPLSGVEGVLVSVTVSVDPLRLEALLDALAHLEFPVNPQIYHQAATTVEFPAYENRLPEIRALLASYGFPGASIGTAAMLDSIRSTHAAA